MAEQWYSQHIEWSRHSIYSCLFCALCPGFDLCFTRKTKKDFRIQTCLQLCDKWESSKYGAAQCYPRYDGGCQGAAYGTNWATNCYPNELWSSDIYNGGSERYTRNLGSGTWNYDTSPYTQADSVRCVLDLTTADGLQLCDAYESSKYGTAQCYWFTGGCQGSYGTSCHPYDLWSGTFDSGNNYKLAQLVSGTLRINAYIRTYTFSVRCLLLARYPATCRAGGHRVRPHPYHPELRYAVSLDLIPADVCSCATTMRVLLTVLHSVRNWLAAARALTILTATRTLFGRLSR